MQNATKLGSTLIGLTVLVALATPATANPEPPHHVDDVSQTAGGSAPVATALEQEPPRSVTPQGVGGFAPIAVEAAPRQEPVVPAPPVVVDESGKLIPVEEWVAVEVGYRPGVPEGFSRGADGVVLHTFDTGAGWSPWTPIGGRRVAGTPSGVYQPGKGSTVVFSRDTDGRLVHAENSGSGWSPWSAIGDQRLAGDPLAVHQPNTGTTEVFARGVDGHLVHTDDSAGEWSAWTTIGEWTITGPLTALHRADSGTTEVTARTTEGRVLRVENAAGGWAIWSVA